MSLDSIDRLNCATAALGWLAMKSYVASLLACTSLGVAVLAATGATGCAEGAKADPSESFLSATPADSGTGEPEQKITIPPPSNPDTTIDDPADSGASSSGASSSGDGGTSSSSSSGGPACAAASPCSGAADLGTISGDSNADSKSAEGHGSAWFKLKVTEDSHGVLGKKLSALSTLTNPPGGANFQLYVYVSSTDSSLECSAVTGSGNNYRAEWGEGDISSGSSDTRIVTLEVRHVSGTCDPNQKWKLKIEGNK